MRRRGDFFLYRSVFDDEALIIIYLNQYSRYRILSFTFEFTRKYLYFNIENIFLF